MDSLDKFLHDVAYKFPKGYPDMNDPKDKDMLFKMIHEVTEEKSLLKEGSELYDKVILNALDTDTIPQSKNKYKFGGSSTFDIQVKSDDLDIWKKLWGVKPPKAGKEVGSAGSLGVGNGKFLFIGYIITLIVVLMLLWEEKEMTLIYFLMVKE